MNPRVALLMLCGAARIASAQERTGLSLALDASQVWARSDAVGTKSVMAGPALGGEGRIAISRMYLSVRYLEGRLQSRTTTGTTLRQDLVEGGITLVGRVLPWLELAAGPSARSYVTDSTTERWIVWRIRTRFEAPILSTGLTSYVDLWRSFGASVSDAAGAGRVQGGETGLVYRPRWPWAIRVSYRIDDALLQAPGRSETLESLGIGFAIEGL
jgi:hypothetical protein